MNTICVSHVSQKDGTIMTVYINERNLRFVGQGASSSVFTDGVYAIKIGHITEYDINKLTALAKYNYAIQIIEWKHCTIPECYVELLKKGYPRWDGVITKLIPSIFSSKTCPMLITELAKPYLQYGKTYSDVYTKRCYSIARKFSDAVYKKTGIRWSDNHPWNLGKRANGNLVILDA